MFLVADYLNTGSIHVAQSGDNSSARPNSRFTECSSETQHLHFNDLYVFQSFPFQTGLNILQTFLLLIKSTAAEMTGCLRDIYQTRFR